MKKKMHTTHSPVVLSAIIIILITIFFMTSSCLQCPAHSPAGNLRAAWEQILVPGEKNLPSTLESFLNHYPFFEPAFNLYLNQSRNMAYIDQAEQFLKKPASRFPGQAFIPAALGKIAAYENNGEKAINYYKKSLCIAPAFYAYQGVIDMHLTLPGEQTTELLNSLGILYMYMKDFNKAVVNLQTAFEYAETINDKLGKCIILTNLAQINIYRHNFNQALIITNSAYALAVELQYPMAQMILLNHFGYIYYHTGDYEEALQYAKQGEKLAKILGIEKETGNFQMLTAISYIKMNEFAKAEVILSSLIDLAEEKELTELLAVAFRATGELYFTQKKYEQALEYCYKALDKLEEYTAGSIPVENKLILLQYGNEFSELTITNLAMLYEITENSQYSIQAFRISEQARSRYLRESLKLTGFSADKNRSLIKTDAFPGENIMGEKLTGRDIIILEYYLTPDNLLLWVISKKGIKFYNTLLTSGKEGSLIKAWKYALLAGDATTETGKKLYSLLLEKALAGVPEQTTLCIVPYGELYGLAFEALPTPDNKFLIEKYSLLYSPSLDILNLLIARNENRKQQWPKDILALGAPLLSAENSIFPELPGSGKEVLGIGRIFPGGDILTGSAANESTIREPGRLEQYRYLHIASHSIIEAADNIYSGILLSGENNKQYDGILTAGEISSLTCTSELVTLSACQTAAGEMVEGDGFSGFSYAWFSAGASSLLLSLWSIEDEFTSGFMLKFYSLLKENGHNKLKALQEAKLHFIRAGVNPRYWSSFILAGEAVL